MKYLKDNSVNLIVTSPPYFNAKEYSKDKSGKDLGNINDYEVWKKEIKKVLITFGGINHLNLISKITNYLTRKFNYTFNCIGDHNKVGAKKIRDAMLNSDCCISAAVQT